jgi:hypothetical protein
MISTIVGEKSRKAYRTTNDIWLAIQSTHRISEALAELMGIQDFAEVLPFTDCIFSRVFVLTFTGNYEWTPTNGWRALVGK